MRTVILHIWFIGLLSLAVVGLHAQQRQARDIRIVAVDSQQNVIPGAACELRRGDKPVATSQTDGSGTAVFSNIENGIHHLTIRKDGFETYVNRGLVSGPDSPSEITSILNVLGVSAEVQVVDPAHNIQDVSSGSSPPSADVSRRSIELLPLATRRVDEAIPLVPGVIRSATGEISINGASEQQSAFRVNGLNVADPASGNFRLNLPVDAVESVQGFRHPYSADFGQFTGGLTDIQTRGGGDKWHYEINDFLPDLRFHNGRIFGIADDTPHLNFNGPLIKDTLFISQSVGYGIQKNPVRGLPFPDD